MKKNTLILFIGITSMALVGCSTNKCPDGVGDNVVCLEQNWTAETREEFYFTSQGSHIMPYQWFLYLEQASNSNLFRSEENIASFRYLPAKPSKWNPDALSVGFVKDVDSTGEEWMGFTCAACHTTQIEYEDTMIRIDGGPTMADFTTFNEQLVEAMSATSKNETSKKFTRFAKNVLKEKYPEEAHQLYNKLVNRTQFLTKRNLVNTSKVKYGYARVDAVGAIFNQVMVANIDMPSNQRDSDAPVSYPFLWGTHQSDVVQWTGFAPNGPYGLGALVRNGGEVLGVYGQVNIPEKQKLIDTYQSSLQITNLGYLEKWVKDLRSPAWPDKILPAIDQEKAKRGKIHYDKYCLSCHQLISRKDEGNSYNAVLTPQTEVGTDPTELENLSRILDSGRFERRKAMVVAGNAIDAKTTGLNPLINSVTGALLAHPVKTLEAIVIEELPFLAKDKEEPSEKLRAAIIEHEKGFNTKPVSGGVYKARPLTGIWATAPYLHNGSVPNLYELLLPSNERSKEFYVGSRMFDPKKVGFETTNGEGLFKFSTEIKGNLNTGHEYGNDGTTKLNDNTQRWELVEYLKTL
jgi:hypothetical protein